MRRGTIALVSWIDPSAVWTLATRDVSCCRGIWSASQGDAYARKLTREQNGSPHCWFVRRSTTPRNLHMGKDFLPSNELESRLEHQQMSCGYCLHQVPATVQSCCSRSPFDSSEMAAPGRSPSHRLAQSKARIEDSIPMGRVTSQTEEF